MPTSFKVKAVYDYASPHDDDLSFAADQIITVTEEEGDDWYYGEYKDEDGSTKEGLFPRNFVERFEPVAPPRPVRSVKKDPTAPAAQPAATKREPQPVPEPQHQDEDPESEEETIEKPEPSSAVLAEESAPEPPPQAQAPRSPEVASPPPPPTTTKPAPPTREMPQETPKEDAPAAAQKTGPSSFRDRIAAFNKSAAPPVAPKPTGKIGGGSSSFVKKQYVAPPPSRNAYVPPPKEPPPQRVFKREENVEMPSQEAAVPEAVRSPPAQPPAEGAEDQPQPTSLKERIALLQKQQLEQASRHAEAAQKKERPKRPPPKKRTESHQADVAEDQVVAEPEETPRGPPVETEDDEGEEATRPQKRRTKSRESVPLVVPAGGPRELFSDTNDADQSAGAETEDNADVAIPAAKAPMPPSRAPQPQPPSEEAEPEPASEEEAGDSDEEEDEMDAETRRRMEIRQRMAKMSGGMGMAGMFGPPGGMPMGQKKSKPSGDSGKKRIESHESESAAPSTAPPVPVMGLPGMALPGMSSVKSPEPTDNPLEVTKEPEPEELSTYDSDPDVVPDVEEAEKHAPSVRRSEDNTRPVPPVPPVPQERSVPQPPAAPRAVPPLPQERPVPPPPPAQSRPVPPPPPAEPPMSPESGSESDDELPPNLSIDTQAAATRAPPAVPSARPQGPRSPTNKRTSLDVASPTSSETTSPPAKRGSRVPPIPGAVAMPSLPTARAPPPPPPTQAPPSRKSTEREAAPISDSEEVTEYEGDYDTDIASGTHHKDALKAHDHTSSNDETLTGDEASYHHGGLPSLGPSSGPPPVPGAGVPRGAPPPPPSQPPKQPRQSADMPRGAPPPPPPPKTESDDDEYDPYNYTSSRRAPSSTNYETVVTPRAEETHFDDDLYSRSPPREPKRPVPPSIPSYSSPKSPHQGPPPLPPQVPPQVPSQGPPQIPFQAAPQAPPQSPPQMHPAASPSMPKQSLDVPRASTSRRSMDASRPSMEGAGGFIADDVDVGRNTQWWTQRKLPPPVFQSRSDVLYEIEESSATQQDGRELAVKHVFALFMDYSQTIITARFDPRDPSHADLQQRHEAPPNRLRQDQLENAHSKYGTKIADMASAKLNTVVGAGSPFALISELFAHLPDALMPVGTRAYGALVYVNLANATVQQHDEIRAGDIVSFRNAKLAGHKGGLKQKYSVDVGKPDCVAVVMDWDGTRKKIRAWEQGRESKKVKLESFKLGDLKSGEVKVWRVMSRGWVGWGGGR